MSLFLKALTQIFSNWKMAVRVSLPLLVLLVVFVIIGTMMFQGIDANSPELFSATNIVLTLIALIIFWIASCSTAVAWHRYILLGERSSNLLIAGKRDRIFPYLVGTIIIALISILIAVMMSIAIGLISTVYFAVLPAEAGFVLALLTTLIAGAIVTTIIIAASVSLPGLAMNNPLGIQGAIDATTPYFGKIFVAMLLIQVLNMIVGIIPSILAPELSGITLTTSISDFNVLMLLAFNFAFYWFSTMLSIGILTVIYGHAVEGRELS